MKRVKRFSYVTLPGVKSQQLLQEIDKIMNFSNKESSRFLVKISLQIMVQS